MSGQQTDLEPTAEGVDERIDGGRAAVVSRQVTRSRPSSCR